MITFNDLMAAAEDIAEVSEDVNLEEFAGISEEVLVEFLAAADVPMNDEEQSLFSGGMLIALRALKRKANDDS